MLFSVLLIRSVVINYFDNVLPEKVLLFENQKIFFQRIIKII